MYWNMTGARNGTPLRWINFNMRCIEIIDCLRQWQSHFRLTLTWDVLKYAICLLFLYPCYRLTLTWDVLKYAVPASAPLIPLWLTLTWDVLKWKKVAEKAASFVINFNMRCIEIEIAGDSKGSRLGLTLTWDVLK